MGHRWWAQIVQERVVIGGAHRVRYGGFSMWHGASDGEAQVGVRGVQVGTVQREHSVVGEEADGAARQRVQDMVIRGARVTVLLPIKALLVMAALGMGTRLAELREVRLKAVALLTWGDDAGTSMVALLLMAVRRMGVAGSLRAVRLKAVALLAWGADAVTYWGVDAAIPRGLRLRLMLGLRLMLLPRGLMLWGVTGGYLWGVTGASDNGAQVEGAGGAGGDSAESIGW